MDAGCTTTESTVRGDGHHHDRHASAGRPSGPSDRAVPQQHAHCGVACRDRRRGPGRTGIDQHRAAADRPRPPPRPAPWSARKPEAVAVGGVECEADPWRGPLREHRTVARTIRGRRDSITDRIQMMNPVDHRPPSAWRPRRRSPCPMPRRVVGQAVDLPQRPSGRPIRPPNGWSSWSCRTAGQDVVTEPLSLSRGRRAAARGAATTAMRGAGERQQLQPTSACAGPVGARAGRPGRRHATSTNHITGSAPGRRSSGRR